MKKGKYYLATFLGGEETLNWKLNVSLLHIVHRSLSLVCAHVRCGTAYSACNRFRTLKCAYLYRYSGTEPGQANVQTPDSFFPAMFRLVSVAHVVLGNFHYCGLRLWDFSCISFHLQRSADFHWMTFSVSVERSKQLRVARASKQPRQTWNLSPPVSREKNVIDGIWSAYKWNRTCFGLNWLIILFY